MAGADDSCLPAVPTAPVSVQHEAEDGAAARGRKRTHNNACRHTQCSWCKHRKFGKCTRLPADCVACRDDYEAAGSGGGGSRTLLPPSSTATRRRKIAKVGKKEEEEKAEEQQEDEEEEEGDDPCLLKKHIRDPVGDMEWLRVFADAFEALVPLEEGPLSEHWKKKVEDMASEIKTLRASYITFRMYVPYSVFLFQ